MKASSYRRCSSADRSTELLIPHFWPSGSWISQLTKSTPRSVSATSHRVEPSSLELLIKPKVFCIRSRYLRAEAGVNTTISSITTPCMDLSQTGSSTRVCIMKRRMAFLASSVTSMRSWSEPRSLPFSPRPFHSLSNFIRIQSHLSKLRSHALFLGQYRCLLRLPRYLMGLLLPVLENLDPNDINVGGYQCPYQPKLVGIYFIEYNGTHIGRSPIEWSLAAACFWYSSSGLL